MAGAFCTRCGSALPPGAVYCPACGARAGGVATTAAAAVDRTHGKAIASLVLGIAGFVVLPVVCSVLAIILGTSARRELAADPSQGGHGLATAGIVLGWVGVGLAVLAVVVFALVAVAFVSGAR